MISLYTMTAFQNPITECFIKRTKGCVCKLENPHYHILGGVSICTSCGLVLIHFVGKLTYLQNVCIILQEQNVSTILF